MASIIKPIILLGFQWSSTEVFKYFAGVFFFFVGHWVIDCLENICPRLSGENVSFSFQGMKS